MVQKTHIFGFKLCFLIAGNNCALLIIFFKNLVLKYELSAGFRYSSVIQPLSSVLEALCFISSTKDIKYLNLFRNKSRNERVAFNQIETRHGKMMANRTKAGWGRSELSTKEHMFQRDRKKRPSIQQDDHSWQQQILQHSQESLITHLNSFYHRNC